MTTKSVFKNRNDSIVNLYCIEDYYDYLYGYMAPSTSYVELFDVEPYENGFLLIVPPIHDIKHLHPVEKFEKITNVFMEQMRWSRLMEVKNVADLNDVIVNGGFGDLVRINEALHEKKVASIADMIYHRKSKVKLVLIAGPSSSGKTSFANTTGNTVKGSGN